MGYDGNLSMDAILGALNTHVKADRWSNCTVRMLNSGNLSMQETLEDPFQNSQTNSPSFFIRCPNGSVSDYTELIGLITQNIPADPIAAFPQGFTEKDEFSVSNLTITFVLCAVCVGSWMLLLVLLLLPANNHNSRKKMVYLGVVYSAIFHTVILSRTMSSIFEQQYADNCQNSQVFRDQMLNSTLFNVMLFFSTLISNLNWLDIVYYMFHNYRKTQHPWIPKFLNNKNRQITIIGLLLTSTQALLVGLKLWVAHPSDAISIAMRVFDIIIYILFAICSALYASRNLRLSLAPKSLEPKASWNAMLSRSWKNYHESVLLLAYNASVMALLIALTLYVMVPPHQINLWMGNVFTFLKVLVTVNTWGLIGVLERLERTFSKETVLGRKINNKDRFFVDPKINYGNEDNFTTGEDIYTAKDALDPHLDCKSVSRRGLDIIAKPVVALKSKLRGDGANGHIMIVPDGDRDVNTRNSGSIAHEIDGQEWNYDEDDGNGSVETLLTRNYIFNHNED
ncbi:LADA_0G01310g1_1 [Lachancea dasiensis]|uniref:LADA_0G01310g1_1 n=1 Tax=Lachancea dasiensis TaxID=1072105 RepID=A0A1G4JQN1_9SACH|nr:LADA_0G01310g1_1 [Lachancea dasiensis]